MRYKEGCCNLLEGSIVELGWSSKDNNGLCNNSNIMIYLKMNKSKWDVLRMKRKELSTRNGHGKHKRRKKKYPLKDMKMLFVYEDI